MKNKKSSKRIQAKDIVIYEKELGTFSHKMNVLQNDLSGIPDLWEFPRERLHIQSNKLLGEPVVKDYFD